MCVICDVFSVLPSIEQNETLKTSCILFRGGHFDAHDGTIFQRLWDEFAAMLVDENMMENRLARKQLSSPTSF